MVANIISPSLYHLSPIIHLFSLSLFPPLSISAVKYMNVMTSVAIVRAPRDHYREVWAAITTITSLQDSACSVNVIHIGGMGSVLSSS